jgi:hypothetical protein
MRPGGAHINEAISEPGELPRAADGNAALEVTDLLCAETQEPLRKTLIGKTVEVVGQFVPGAASGVALPMLAPLSRQRPGASQ